MNVSFTMLDKLIPEVVLIHNEAKFYKLYRELTGTNLTKDLSQYDGLHASGWKEGKPFAMIYLSRNDKRPLADDFRILVHEATHVKQTMMQIFGEDTPGVEMEAIFMECLVKDLMVAHREWLRKKGVNKCWTNENS